MIDNIDNYVIYEIIMLIKENLIIVYDCFGFDIQKYNNCLYDNLVYVIKIHKVFIFIIIKHYILIIIHNYVNQSIYLIKTFYM